MQEHSTHGIAALPLGELTLAEPLADAPLLADALPLDDGLDELLEALPLGGHPEPLDTCDPDWLGGGCEPD